MERNGEHQKPQLFVTQRTDKIQLDRQNVIYTSRLDQVDNFSIPAELRLEIKQITGVDQGRKKKMKPMRLLACALMCHLLRWLECSSSRFGVAVLKVS